MNPPFPCKPQSAQSDLHMVTTTYLAFSTLSMKSSMRRQRRAIVASSDMPKWLEPKGSRGMMVSITIIPVCVYVCMSQHLQRRKKQTKMEVCDGNILKLKGSIGCFPPETHKHISKMYIIQKCTHLLNPEPWCLMMSKAFS